MKKNIVIIILSILVLGLGGCLIYNKVIDKKNENSNTTSSDESTTYKAYSKGEEITLKDGSEWLVLEDSGESTDYVKLLSKDGFNDYEVGKADTHCSEECNEKLNKIFMGSEAFDYSTSYLKTYFEDRIKEFPVTLKEVDGYSIRLITVDEITAFDSNWKFEGGESYGSYEYTGSDLNEYLKHVGYTMTPYPYGGKAGPVYLMGSAANSDCYDNNGECTYRYFMSGWSAGLMNISPVIYALKSSI